MPLLNKFPNGKGGHFCIPKRINASKMRPFGIALLDSTTEVDAIIYQCRDVVFSIISQILTKWTQGQGIEDYTWNGLIEVLREPAIALIDLANDIEEVVGK